MNKFFSLMLASAATLGLAGCASDQDAPEINSGAQSSVTLSVNLPSTLGTRAYGDGTEALNLYYAVYNDGQATPVY